MHHMLHLCMAFEQMDLPHQNYPQHWQLIFTIDQKEISHFPYGSNAFNYVTRELLVLPVQLGGPVHQLIQQHTLMHLRRLLLQSLLSNPTSILHNKG